MDEVTDSDADCGRQNEHLDPVMHAASDAIDEAVGAGGLVLGGIDSTCALIHSSNNVLVATSSFVAKVSFDDVAIRREHAITLHSSRRCASVLAPVMAPQRVGRFTVAVWPRVELSAAPTRRDSAHALAEIHRSLSDFTGELPGLDVKLEEAARLAQTTAVVELITPRRARSLRAAIDHGRDLISASDPDEYFMVTRMTATATTSSPTP